MSAHERRLDFYHDSRHAGDEHEPERDEKEGRLFLEAADYPHRYAEYRERRDELVRRAEDGPDDLPRGYRVSVGALGLHVDENERNCDGDYRRKVFVDLVVRYLLYLIAGETRRRVERGEQEGVDRYRSEARSEHGVDADYRAELSEARGEGADGAALLYAARDHHSAERYDGDETFEEHRGVADRQCVALMRELLRRSSGADERMEARDGSACDDDEEHRPEVAPAESKPVYLFRHHRHGSAVHRAAEYHSNRAYRSREVQEVRGEVVARLKKQPDGEDGGAEDVYRNKEVPPVGAVREYLGDYGPVAALDGAESYYREHHYRDELEIHVEAVDEQPRDDREYDVHAADEGDDGVEHEGRRRKDGEDRDDEEEREYRKYKEEFLRLVAYPVVDDLAYRLTVVAHRGHNGAEVAPYDSREPAEHRGRRYRPDDGASARDGRKVVPEHDGGVRRTVVHAVVETLRGRDVVVVKVVDPRHKAPVENVAEYQADD